MPDIEIEYIFYFVDWLHAMDNILKYFNVKYYKIG